jgi:hypothetical protein
MAHKKGRGRPSVFKRDYVAQASKLCVLGATDIEIADFFGVNPATIHRWKHNHPEFCESIKLGKEALDERVSRSLYHRAVGYSFDAEKIQVLRDGEVVRVPYREHVPPDTTAMIFWLKNRRPKEWRDVHKHEVGGPGDFDRLTNQELELKIINDAKALGATPEALEVLRLTFQPKGVIEGEAVADSSQQGSHENGHEQ